MDRPIPRLLPAILTALLLLVTAATGIRADDVTTDAELTPLERPVSLFVRTTDGESLRGELTAWSLDAFELRLKEDEPPRRLAWSRVEPARAYSVLARLHESADAEGWLRLGAAARAWDGGETYAERAFTRAERLDPSLKERIERARRGEPIDEPDPAEGADATTGDGDGETPPVPDDGAPAAAGPELVGAIQAAFWGNLTAEQHAEAIGELNAFTDEATAKIGVEMRLFETEFFLFYTDLEPREAQKWAGLLDKMHHRLCDLFGIARGTNIWRGKCLIFVFRNERDFHRFEAEVYGNPSEGIAAGRCRGFGNGLVHVTFFRQPHESRFAHVLVHEAVHGFLHRYRSPIHIPSVWNEGLAEVIAGELVPQDNTVAYRQRMSETMLKQVRGFAGMWHLPQIEGWHYGLASSLTAMMIRENKKGYVAFVNGIKDGLDWHQSLEQHYGVSLEKLVRYYGDQIGVRNLQP